MIINDLTATGVPAALAYTLCKFFVGGDVQQIELMTKVLNGAEAGLFLKAIYDFYSATTTAAKVSAALAMLKCLLAVCALSYNLISAANAAVAPAMFVGVFTLSAVVNLITACVSGTSTIDRLAQGYGVAANAVTAVGVLMGLILGYQKKAFGFTLTAAQGGLSLVNGLVGFFRPCANQAEGEEAQPLIVDHATTAASKKAAVN